MIKAVFFDFDNTLIDLLTAEAAADAFIANELAKEYGLKPKDFLTTFNNIKHSRIHKRNQPEEYSRILWITETLGLMGQKVDYDFVDKLVLEYWKVLKRGTRLFPKAKEALHTLRKNYKLGLITDSDGNKRIKMDRIKSIGVLNDFDTIVTSDDVGFDKPDKENFKLACKNLDVNPKECVMIGDSPNRDLKPAKQLGMKIIWTKQAMPVQKSYPWIDHEVSDIGDVVDIIKKMH